MIMNQTELFREELENLIEKYYCTGLNIDKILAILEVVKDQWGDIEEEDKEY